MRCWNLPFFQWSLSLLAFASNLHGQNARVVEKEGRVILTKAGARPTAAEIGAGLGVRDKLGTGESSRAVLKMSEKWFARVDEQTDIEITPGAFAAKDRDALKVALGGAFIYSREEEGELKIHTPSATAGLRGTQLSLRVLPDGKTFIQVLEGQVDLVNELGAIALQQGEAGEAERGRPPRRTAVIDARNALQWALYYPAVIQPDELGFTTDEQRSFAESLEAYRAGDLLSALATYPNGYVAETNAARLYYAAVLLAAGQVDEARAAIADVPVERPGRRALERMLAAVLAIDQPGLWMPVTGSEAMAESYYQQSNKNLEPARNWARRATELAPMSGYGWTRLAELEFSFGRRREALVALSRALELSPRNAQAHALRGYLLSAESRISEAKAAFQEALRLDGALGNAWLGLGLTRIKLGEQEEGRSDLQTAVTVEPTRAFFYSYHGKALSGTGRSRLATKDFELAKHLDPNDPTPWLYSAIQAQQDNRYNSAIHNMEEALHRNDERRLYRSQLLLDQDRAVRSSNLARIYQNNGMSDVAVREGTLAVERDYTNASAHLFLANSYDALRDPRRFSLRFETAWFNELLLAYLLAPVGGGPLSQFLSQQEYSRLLEADGFGGSLLTEWRTDGALEQQASLHGTRGRMTAGLDFAYRSINGSRPNNSSLRREMYGQFKYQVTADDVFYSLVRAGRQDTGDLQRNLGNVPGNLALRYEERQRPGLLLAGWNRQWAPGVHTLFIGGRLSAEENLTAPGTRQLLLERDPVALEPGFLRRAANGALEYSDVELRTAATPPVSSSPAGPLNVSNAFQRAIAEFSGRGAVNGVFSDMFDFATHREFEIHTAELQHLWQAGGRTLLAGGRMQGGEFDTTTRLDLLNRDLAPLATSPAALQRIATDFRRQSVYAYAFAPVTPWLTLIGGVAWDAIERPENFRNPPVSARHVEQEETSVKFGFTLSPAPTVKIRGVYTESLGGVTFDESVRLEPVQLAGFNQAFRNVIEATTGAVETPRYENVGTSIEGALPTTRTWWGAGINVLTEEVARTIGAFDILTAPIFPHGLAILPAGTAERLDYRETVYSASASQLVGTEFAFTAGFRHSRAELRRRFPEIPVALATFADRRERARLDEAMFSANWNSPRGWFARAQANWFSQRLGGVLEREPSDRFWHVSAQVGFRFDRNRRELSAGVLNLTDRDYRLSPLTYTLEPARERTFFVRARVRL